MTEKVEAGASVLDTVKLAAAAAILVGGVAGFYLLSDYPLAVRWVVVLLSLAIGIFVALQSEQGRVFWQFVQGSRVELRKVVWPTRQETLQTTLVVFVGVVVMAIFFWILDAALGWIMENVVGRGTGS